MVTGGRTNGCRRRWGARTASLWPLGPARLTRVVRLSNKTVIWSKIDLEHFFGCRPSLGINDERVYIFDYASKRLRYQLFVHEKEEQVSVSADPETPFGGDSFYEVYVPCDTIQLLADPYHPEFKAVGFWYGGATDRKNLRLTIMKRPDGDLKVWPAFAFPKSHPAAEPGASPNGGPAERLENPGVTEGPPSVT